MIKAQCIDENLKPNCIVVNMRCINCGRHVDFIHPLGMMTEGLRMGFRKLWLIENGRADEIVATPPGDG